jgi:hypothetical protein
MEHREPRKTGEAPTVTPGARRPRASGKEKSQFKASWIASLEFSRACQIAYAGIREMT